jgi:hypothetical protein
MRKFSRWMPPASRPPTTIAGWAILAGLLAAVIAALIGYPLVVGSFCGLIAIGTVILNLRRDQNLRRLASERGGEDIGTYARAFNRRSEAFDPWVVRATWDALQPYVAFRGGRVPIRPGDRLKENYGIDPEDFGDLLLEVADRSGHSVDQDETTPFEGPVDTVGDFVRFVTYHPRRESDRIQS